MLCFFAIELHELVIYFVCLFILKINLLLVASFAHIFSDSVSYLSILFIGFFAMQKHLNLIRSQLFIFIFIFIFITLAGRSK